MTKRCCLAPPTSGLLAVVINQDVGVDVVGSVAAGSQGQGRDEAGVQGGRRGLQLPAGEARAHLEHPRRA